MRCIVSMIVFKLSAVSSTFSVTEILVAKILGETNLVLEHQMALKWWASDWLETEMIKFNYKLKSLKTSISTQVVHLLVKKKKKIGLSRKILLRLHFFPTIVIIMVFTYILHMWSTLSQGNIKIQELFISQRLRRETAIIHVWAGNSSIIPFRTLFANMSLFCFSSVLFHWGETQC